MTLETNCSRGTFQLLAIRPSDESCAVHRHGSDDQAKVTLVLLVTSSYADAEVVPVRQIDNSAVLSAQLARLSQVRSSRDEGVVATAIAAIEAAAKGKERKPNLLELAVQVNILQKTR